MTQSGCWLNFCVITTRRHRNEGGRYSAHGGQCVACFCAFVVPYLFCWRAQRCICLYFHLLYVRRDGVGQFLYYFFLFCFSVAYVCVAPVALMCVPMTMSRAVVAAVAAADESDYIDDRDAMSAMYTHTHTHTHTLHIHETHMLSPLLVRL